MRTTLAAALCVVMFAGAAPAAVIIDDFSSTSGGWPLSTTTVGVLHNEEAGLTGVVGGQRHTRVEVTSAQGSITEQFIVANGVYTHTTTDRGTATSELSYGAYRNGASAPWSVLVDHSFDLNADLSGDLGILLQIKSVDQGDEVQIKILADGVEYTNGSFQITAPGDIAVPFAAFGLSDLSSVDGFYFKFVGPTAWDLSLDGVGTYIPEPTSMAILAVGAIGLISRRRRRRPVQA